MSIDTSTTAGKIAVMQAFDRGEEVQARVRCTRNWSIPRTKTDSLSEVVWDWLSYEYRVKPKDPREWTVYINKDHGAMTSMIYGFDHENWDQIKVREVIE